MESSLHVPRKSEIVDLIGYLIYTHKLMSPWTYNKFLKPVTHEIISQWTIKIWYSANIQLAPT